MSTIEFLGIWLGLCVAIAAAVCVRIGYETAKMRHWRITLVYLRLGGILSIAVWLIMFAVLVLVHDDKQTMAVSTSPAASKIASQSDVSIKMPSGSVISWTRPATGVPVWQIERGI